MTVWNAERDADTGKDRQIDDIVADEAALIRSMTGFFKQLGERLLFFASPLNRPCYSGG